MKYQSDIPRSKCRAYAIFTIIHRCIFLPSANTSRILNGLGKEKR